MQRIVLSWRGVFAAFTLVLLIVVAVAIMSVRRAKKKWVENHTPMSTPIMGPLERALPSTPVLVGDDGQVLMNMSPGGHRGGRGRSNTADTADTAEVALVNGAAAYLPGDGVRGRSIGGSGGSVGGSSGRYN